MEQRSDTNNLRLKKELSKSLNEKKSLREQLTVSQNQLDASKQSYQTL